MRAASIKPTFSTEVLMLDHNEKLSGTWVTRNVELAADPAAGWALVHAITTYCGDLEGVGHAGSSTLRTADGGLRAYHNETVAVTGALSGSFLNFGTVEVFGGKQSEMVATLHPAMGTGDFAGVVGEFGLTIREVGDSSYAGDWSLDIGPR
jgi:hypothetical protein